MFPPFSSRKYITIAVISLIVCSVLILSLWTFPLCLEPHHILIGHPGDSIMTLERWENWHIGVKYIERPLLNIAGAFLSDSIDPIIIYNLFIAISFPLTALTAFALYRWVTGNTLASAIAALYFAFSPYHWAHSLGHLYLSHIQWIPLTVLSLALFITTPSFRTSILLLVSAALLIGTSYYYAFFLFLIITILLPFAIIAFATKGSGKKIAYIAGIAVCMVLASLPLTHSYLSWILNKPVPRIMLVDDMLRYSARPLEYIFPGGISAFNRLWSPIIEPGSLHASNEVEQAIFIGWVPMILAGIAVIDVFKRRTPMIRRTALAWIGAGAFIALILSAPPVISLGSFHIWTPNYYVTRIIPFFRSFVRMAVFVQIGVYLLAAIGLMRIMQRNSKWVILAGILGILEFTPIPPSRIVRLHPDRPVHDYVISEPSDQHLIEFPFSSRRTPQANRRMYWSFVHGRYSVEETSTLDVRHCSEIDEQTCRELKRAGIGLAIFHHDPPEPQLLVHKDRIERDPSILRPWPRIRSSSYLHLESHHPGALTYSIRSPVSPLDFGIRDGPGRWEEGRYLIGRQLTPFNEFGIRSQVFRPIQADLTFIIGHTKVRPAQWHVHINGNHMSAVATDGNILTIQLHDVELLPDLNIIHLSAHDKTGAAFPSDTTMPVGLLREVYVNP